MRHIDSFCHFFPSGIFHLLSATAGGTVDIGKRIQGVRTIWDLDARFRMMDEFRDYTQVLSLGLPPLEGMVGPDRTPEFARVANDGLAELVAKHPLCAGAYTGNRPDRKPESYGGTSIDLATFAAHVRRQIDEHNRQPGRRAAACGGRSLRETLEASLADPGTLIRWPT